MFNRKIADSKSPCLNCIERWIDIENMKRCDSHCDKRKKYLELKVINDLKNKIINEPAYKRRAKARIINEKRYK